MLNVNDEELATGDEDDVNPGLVRRAFYAEHFNRPREAHEVQHDGAAYDPECGGCLAEDRHADDYWIHKHERRGSA